MTGGLTPEEYGRLQEQGLYAGVILGAVVVATLLAIWAAAEAWGNYREHKAKRAAAQQSADQIQAGIAAGWHDPSPADRRRDR